jgi:hypothetical protein
MKFKSVEERNEHIFELVRNGYTSVQIGKVVGLHPGSIRSLVNRRPNGKILKSKTKKTNGDEIEQILEESKERVFRREVGDLNRKLSKLSEQVSQKSIFDDNIKDSIKRVHPIDLQYRPSKDKSKPSVSLVITLGDWHIGADVKPEETQGFGHFNFDVATKRLKNLISAIVNWVSDLRQSANIDECVILGLADYIDGLIHDEIRIYSEFAPPEQVTRAGYLLAEFCRQIAGHFKKVRIHSLSTDNHSRLTKKPMMQGRADWSLGFLVNEFARVALEDVKNLEFHIINAIKGLVEVQNHKFLIEHGNDIKSQMGIPYYGIQRVQGREAMRRMNTPDQTFDYHVIGHYHTPAFMGNFIMNGALCGATVFDHSLALNARPCQVAFLVHPKWGLYNFVPFWLDATRKCV